MASSNRRKTAALALAFVGVAGLSIASAAQLNLGTGSLGAGTTVVASCQTTGTIGVNFETAFAGAEYKASTISLSSIDAKCAGLKYKVTLTDSTGATIGTEATGTVPATTGTATVTLNATLTGVSAKAITNVAVVIYS